MNICKKWTAANSIFAVWVYWTRNWYDGWVRYWYCGIVTAGWQYLSILFFFHSFAFARCLLVISIYNIFEYISQSQYILSIIIIYYIILNRVTKVCGTISLWCHCRAKHHRVYCCLSYVRARRGSFVTHLNSFLFFRNCRMHVYPVSVSIIVLWCGLNIINIHIHNINNSSSSCVADTKVEMEFDTTICIRTC